ncbi:MAG: hypothetical protein KKG59_07610 [Nanoarchaeota archaeon]|nr:hypothetical protein [Nanoarchaeota archaeon]
MKKLLLIGPVILIILLVLSGLSLALQVNIQSPIQDQALSDNALIKVSVDGIYDELSVLIGDTVIGSKTREPLPVDNSSNATNTSNTTTESDVTRFVYLFPFDTTTFEDGAYTVDVQVTKDVETIISHRAFQIQNQEGVSPTKGVVESDDSSGEAADAVDGADTGSANGANESEEDPYSFNPLVFRIVVALMIIIVVVILFAKFGKKKSRRGMENLLSLGKPKKLQKSKQAKSGQSVKSAQTDIMLNSKDIEKIVGKVSETTDVDGYLNSKYANKIVAQQSVVQAEEVVAIDTTDTTRVKLDDITVVEPEEKPDEIAPVSTMNNRNDEQSKTMDDTLIIEDHLAGIMNNYAHQEAAEKRDDEVHYNRKIENADISDLDNESLMQLELYIEEMRSTGMPNEIIQENLKGSGWPEHMISEIIHKSR